jgi:predicted phosphodiesterase
MFCSVDSARNNIKYLTGNNGVYCRKRAVSNHEDTFRQPFSGDKLPVPTPFWDSTPFIFNTETCLIIADIHIPFHLKDAIEITIKYAKQHGVKDVLILGDMLDHYQESDFCRVPDVSTLTQELNDGKQMLQWLRRKFPKAKIIFKEGNHEERFAVKVHRSLPEAGRLLDDFTYDKLGFKEIGITLIKDRRRIDMGYLTAIHGHELGRGTSVLVNAARTLQLRAKECSIVGHWHAPAQHRARTLRQNHIGTWAIGCLCNLTPNYRPINDWELGFAIFRRVDNAGNFVIENKTIIDGMVV